MHCRRGKAVGYTKLYGYFLDYGLPQLDADVRGKVKKYQELAIPFLTEFENHAHQIAPSMDASQDIFVLDFKTHISRLPGVPKLPRGARAGIGALAITLQDGDKFLDAMSSYLKLVEGFYPKIRPLLVEEAKAPLPPTLEIPRPQTSALGEAKMFFYPLPDIDDAILPHAVVGKNMLIVSSSPALSRGLMTAGEMPKDELVAIDQPAQMVVSVRLAPLCSAIREWVELAKESPGFKRDMGPKQIETFNSVFNALETAGTAFKRRDRTRLP